MNIDCMFCGKTAELYEPWVGIQNRDGDIVLVHTVCYREWWDKHNKIIGDLLFGYLKGKQP